MKYNFDSRIIHLVGVGGGGGGSAQNPNSRGVMVTLSKFPCVMPTHPIINPNQLLKLSHKLLHTFHQNGLSVLLLSKMDFSFFFEPVQYENIKKKVLGKEWK